MKKKKKWKTWLSEQYLKYREHYTGIPGFFKKRIVNTLLLSFLLLYGGCALGLAQKSADLWDGQFFWQSVELGMRGIFITWQLQNPMRWWKEL